MKRRGMTLVEVLTATMVVGLVVTGGIAMLLTGLKSFATSSTDSEITDTNSQALRRIAQTLRNARTVTLNGEGTVLTYTLPAYAAGTNAVTGEQELAVPVVSDGVNRTYTVNFTAGTLTDSTSGRVLVRNIVSTDPLVGSSQYNQQYLPFQLTTIGSVRAVSINLITRGQVGPLIRYARLKTSAKLRNQ